jgi:hypothetical protein
MGIVVGGVQSKWEIIVLKAMKLDKTRKFVARG